MLAKMLLLHAIIMSINLIRIDSQDSTIADFFKAMEQFQKSAEANGLGSGYGIDKYSQLMRYRIFKKEKAEVDQINHDSSLPFTAETNKFSVMTDAELDSYTGLNISLASNDKLSNSLGSINNLGGRGFPKYINWNEHGAVTDVQDQGSCRSCWAFAVTGALEGAYFQQTGQLVKFSEQEMLSCTYEHLRNKDGCEGGWLSDPVDYLKRSQRISTLRDAPYLKIDTSCNRYNYMPNGIEKIRVMGYFENQNKPDVFLQAGVTRGPVAAAVCVQKSFHKYKSGIFQIKEQPTVVNHAVLVVGEKNLVS